MKRKFIIKAEKVIVSHTQISVEADSEEIARAIAEDRIRGDFKITTVEEVKNWKAFWDKIMTIENMIFRPTSRLGNPEYNYNEVTLDMDNPTGNMSVYHSYIGRKFDIAITDTKLKLYANSNGSGNAHIMSGEINIDMPTFEDKENALLKYVPQFFDAWDKVDTEPGENYFIDRDVAPKCKMFM